MSLMWWYFSSLNVLYPYKIATRENTWVIAHRRSFSETKIYRDLVEGERGKRTKFFQKMANAPRRRNFFSKIKVNGAWFKKENDIKERVVQAFHNLLFDLGD